MRNYEVRLKRTLTQTVYATVSVMATSEAEAVQRAREHAFDKEIDWSQPLGEPVDSGPLEVDTIEAIVDVD